MNEDNFRLFEDNILYDYVSTEEFMSHAPTPGYITSILEKMDVGEIRFFKPKIMDYFKQLGQLDYEIITKNEETNTFYFIKRQKFINALREITRNFFGNTENIDEFLNELFNRCIPTTDDKLKKKTNHFLYAFKFHEHAPLDFLFFPIYVADALLKHPEHMNYKNLLELKLQCITYHGGKRLREGKRHANQQADSRNLSIEQQKARRNQELENERAAWEKLIKTQQDLVDVTGPLVREGDQRVYRWMGLG